MIRLPGYVTALLLLTALAGNAADITEQTGGEHRAHGHKDMHHRPLFRYSYDVSIAHDDNIRRSQNAVDIRSDLVNSLTFNVKGGRPVDDLSLLNFGGSATYEAYDIYSDLSNFNFNLNARYRFAFSTGFTSPIYSAGIKLGGIESELEMRDSTWFSIALQMNKWITSTINTTLGLDYKQRMSKSEVFDMVENRLFVNFDLDLSSKALLYGTYTFITGDIVSGATPTLQFINGSDAIEPDDAFGGTAANQFVYRLDADTNVVTLGYNRVVTRSISFDVSLRLVDTTAAGGIFYDRQILRASMLGRF